MITPFFSFFLFLLFFLFLHYFICKTSEEMCRDILTENRYHWICQGDWWTFPKRFANVHLSLACEWFKPKCWEMTSRVFRGSEICPRMLISVFAAHWHARGYSLTPKSNIDPPAGQTNRWNIPTLCREEIQGLRYRAIYTRMLPLSIARLFFIESTWGYRPLKIWMALGSLTFIIWPILYVVEQC